MSRPAKGVRLWLKPEERDSEGKLRKRAVWIIRDGSRSIITGCAAIDREGAEKKLGDYISEKYQPGRDRDSRAAEVLVTDVLAVYQKDKVPEQARPEKSIERIMQLGQWWVGKTLADINGETCRQYVKWRCAMPWKSARPHQTKKLPRMVSAQGARRELEDLRAAVNYHRKEGFHREVIEVTLPERGESRELWLTRDQAAKLLWVCWRTREKQKGIEVDKFPLRHLVRFILPGIYTGTRPGAICDAAMSPIIGHGWIDIDSGVWYRQKIGRKETKKRQTPVKLPDRLLAHIRRWVRLGIVNEWLVEFYGAKISEVNKGVARAVKLAGLNKGLVPHVISRHTCATWLMQAGADKWSAAGFLGMTVQQLEDTYGHHHPDYQEDAANKVGGKKKQPRQKGNVIRLAG